MKYIFKLIIVCLAVVLVSCNKNESPVSPELKEGKWEVISNAGADLGIGKIYFADAQNGWVLGDSGKVSVTNNGGMTWTKQATGNKGTLRAICFIDSKNGFTGGNDPFLYKTTDGGLNWQKAAFNNDTSNFVTFIYYKDGRLWLGSKQKVYISDNYGQTWTSRSTYRYAATDFFTFGNTAFASFWTSGVLQRSIDNAQSWTELPLPTMWSNNIYFLNERNGWATENLAPSSTKNDSSSVYYTNDGGESWRRVIKVEGIETDNVYFSDQNNGWFSSNSWSIMNGSFTTRIYNTTDGGKTFNVQFSLSGYDDPIVDMYFLNESNAWALTFRGKVIRFSR